MYDTGTLMLIIVFVVVNLCLAIAFPVWAALCKDVLHVAWVIFLVALALVTLGFVSFDTHWSRG